MAIVSECAGHTCHSQHHVLWYLSSTYDNRLIKYLHINSIFKKKHVFLKSGGGGGGEFTCPVQGWGSTCRFGARSEGSQRVRSINRIAPQGSHRYSRRGHDTIVLHLWRHWCCFSVYIRFHSSLGRNGWRMFYSRVSFLCWLLFRRLCSGTLFFHYFRFQYTKSSTR